MTKTQAIALINKNTGVNNLIGRNTTFAHISSSRNAWWMNIKLENFSKDWNIILVGENELLWLKIPAETFSKPENFFKIWETKKAVDIYISADPLDRYLKDLATGGTGVDFKSFILKKFNISQEPREKDSASIIKESRVNNLQQGQRILKENEDNISYQSLFAEHLIGANKIILQDPYIRYPHQFKNLLEFCVMLGKNKNPEKEIHLEIVTWNSEEFHRQSKAYFEEVVESVSDLRINLSYKFEEHHDRYIQTDNGWKIVLGRGLDIFQKPEGRFSIGDIDQSRRKCKACEITYFKV